jgi:hypothetical protein
MRSPRVPRAFLVLVASLLACASIAVFVLTGCTRPVEGPVPELDGEVDPVQACNGLNEENEDIQTIVTLRSASGTFSPLPVDVLEDAGLELPRVFLIRDEEEIELPDVRYVDPNELQVVIDTDPPLEPGIYQFTVENPNGNRSEVNGEIEIVPPPTIERVERVGAVGDEGPAEVCLGYDQQLRIIGTGFRPADPPPTIQVVLCSDLQDITSCTEVVTELEDVEVVSETEILATLRAGSLPDGPATYGLRLINPEQPPCTATITVALTTASTDIEVNAVIPEQGWTGVDTPVQVFGGNFTAPVELRLVGAAPDGSDWDLVDERVDGTGTRIDAIVPEGGEPGGPYDLIVAGEEGCETVLEAAFTILGDPSLTVTEVIPPFGWTEAKTPVTILGSDFVSTPRAYLVIESMTPRLQALKSTGYVSDSSLNSVVPEGLDVGGPYDLVVINPDGGGGKLEQAFRVTAEPPPTVLNVTPAIGDTQDPTPVTITGCHFRDPATVEAIAPDGGTTSATVGAAPVCDGAATCPGDTNVCTMGATIPTETMDVGPYVIRVTNTDENTWGDWSLFVVTLPSGKLDVWQPGEVDLTLARRQHAGVAGRINNASRYLYAIGGDGGAGGDVLDAVDVVPLDLFGSLGAPFEQRYHLNRPRTQVSAVQVGGYIYVVGGTSDGTAELDTVERAKILTFDDQPVLEDPSINAGTLDAGAWYYQVAAFYDAGHADNPGGETLPSDEVVISLGIGGGVALTWQAVPDAAGYRIYRTESPDGTSNTEVFLDEVDAATTTYVDDGAVAVDPTRTPLRRGATGVWVELDEALVHARRGHAVALAHDSTGEAFLYAVGGVGSCDGGPAGAMDCFEVAPLSDAGATLGAWTEGTERMVSGRSLFGIAPGENDGSSQIPVGEAWLFVTGGVDATTTAEAARVLDGGQLEPWIELAPPVSAQPTERAGHGMQLVANAMFVIGGSAGTTVDGPPLDSSQFSQEFDGTPPGRTSFSNSTATMNVPRALYTLVLESGLFYAIGGSTDTDLTDATADIEMIVY